MNSKCNNFFFKSSDIRRCAQKYLIVYFCKEILCVWESEELPVEYKKYKPCKYKLLQIKNKTTNFNIKYYLYLSDWNLMINILHILMFLVTSFLK